MNNKILVHGIRYVLKEYHEVMAAVLEARKQTQAEAAKELGISLSYFHQLYRLKRCPNFFTERGKVFADRIRNWSGIAAGLVFPEGFYTRQFLARDKTHTVSVPWSRFLRYGDEDRPLALPVPYTVYSSPKPIPPRMKRRKRRARKV
jgi:hypothetical protein